MPVRRALRLRLSGSGTGPAVLDAEAGDGASVPADPAPAGWATGGGVVAASGGAPAASSPGGGGSGGGGDGRGRHAVPITGGRGRSASDEDSLAPAEERICTIHPAMFRAHPGRYLLIVLMALAGLSGLLYGAITGADDRWGWLVWPGGVLLLAAAIWWVIWWFFGTLCVKLVITNKRSMRSEGFIRRASTEVLHDHVRSVDIRQGFVERMLNVGYIGIDSAGQDGIEIEIDDIPRPHDVKAIIDRYRRM